MFVKLLSLGFVVTALCMVLFNVTRFCRAEFWPVLSTQNIAVEQNITSDRDGNEKPGSDHSSGSSDDAALLLNNDVHPGTDNDAANTKPERESTNVLNSVLDLALTDPETQRAALDEAIDTESLELVRKATLSSTSFSNENESINSSHESSSTVHQFALLSRRSILIDAIAIDHVQPAAEIFLEPRMTHPAMNVHNFRLLQYRRMMKRGCTPHPTELLGSWRGVNKGVATLAIDRQFIKHFYMSGGRICGDNIMVHQVPDSQLRQCGWRPIVNSHTGQVQRQGRFAVQPPQGIGPFRHGLVLNYRAGGNSRRDPARMIWDQVVKLDDNHMLGRATIRIGLARVPMAFFVLERIVEPAPSSPQPAKIISFEKAGS